MLPQTKAACVAELCLGHARIEIGADLIISILCDRSLECAKCQRRAARARADNLTAELVDHIVEIHVVDLGQRPALDHLCQDRCGSLADCASGTLKCDML